MGQACPSRFMNASSGNRFQSLSATEGDDDASETMIGSSMRSRRSGHVAPKTKIDKGEKSSRAACARAGCVRPTWNGVPGEFCGILCRVAATDGIILTSAPSNAEPVRIVHLSDTHGMHRDIKLEDVPVGDIFIHTGDFSNHGTSRDFADFDDWLGDIGRRFRHVILIPGNHDWWDTVHDKIENGRIDPKDAISQDFMKRKFKNGLVLNNEEIVVEGLRIFGSAWAPWQDDSCPDFVGEHPGHEQTSQALVETGGTLDTFALIRNGVDILLTHGPATDIMDSTGSQRKGDGWGSSDQLFNAIQRAKPRAHLFGHLHEQRGLWTKTTNSTYTGGIEYTIPGERRPFPTIGPPPRDYPCEIISCNAMCNHPHLDGTGRHYLAGPARLILMMPRT